MFHLRSFGNRLIDSQKSPVGNKGLSECEEKINRMEAKLKAAVNFQTTAEPLWNKAFNNIAQLDRLYKEGTVELKRKIVGSMFPENLVFDGCQHRTKRLNEIINIIS